MGLPLKEGLKPQIRRQFDGKDLGAPVGTSIKRRIETILLSPKSRISRRLPLGLPLKEGLKPSQMILRLTSAALPLGLPLKEGLKRQDSRKFYVETEAYATPVGTSIKRRIETKLLTVYDSNIQKIISTLGLPLKEGLKPGKLAEKVMRVMAAPVGTSIKRRIETRRQVVEGIECRLPLGLPLKEGLKPEDTELQPRNSGVNLPLGLPLKEGLKLISTEANCVTQNVTK